MIKTKLILLAFVIVQLTAAFSAFGDGLYLIHSKDAEEQKQLAANPAFKVHFFADNWIIASAASTPKQAHSLLSTNAWATSEEYYVVYVPDNEKPGFLSSRPAAIPLYNGEGFLVLSWDSNNPQPLQPFKSDGMLRISKNEAKLAQPKGLSPARSITPDPFVEAMLEQVSAGNITTTVQHLQDYGTRNAYHAQSVAAQNWIKSQFQNMGLSVEVMDFSMPSGSASDNVIATLTGTKYPQEFVVIGGHYDSYSGGSSAPGADDNASGTAGVLEIARIMSQHTFDRSVVFCAFSGEEYGLYGSDAYASRAAQLGMDIHGYFNLDMIGYLKPGNTTIKSTLIYPAAAQELATFYVDVAAAYLPQFVVSPGYLSGGDSDHTSFNNNGFMGIFPFEAVPDYSPYIHTTNDIVGPSYNNENQAAVFTKASLAAAATLANRLNPPRGLVALAGDQMVELVWTTLPDAASFNIYRDGQLYQNVAGNSFVDTMVTNGITYSYYITAIYAGSNLESDPSNTVSATPMPPLSLPFVTDFENGAPYFEFAGGWGVSTTQSHSPTHSITESPSGQYQNDVTSYAYLRPVNLSTGFTSAEVSFWTRYDLESNYDYTWFEVSTNGSNWVSLAQFNGTQTSWQKKTYNLNSFLNQPFVQFRFKFVSDGSVTQDGLYVDDFELVTSGGYPTQTAMLAAGWNTLSSHIVPASPSLQDVFAPVAQNLIAVQTLTGSYIPAQGFNTIGNWDASTGYKIKMNTSSSLTIGGPADAPTSINLQPGWNLLPVLSGCAVNVESLFENQTNKIVMIKEMGSDLIYWPSIQLNTLQQLMPSKAYLAKITENIQIDFPACKHTEQTENMVNTLMSNPVMPNTHVFGLSTTALSVGDAGNLIMAFTPGGNLVGQIGAGAFLSPQALAVYGDDSLSVALEGLIPGETIIWKLRDQTTGYYYNLTPVYAGNMPQQGLYEHEGISYIESFTADATGVEEEAEGLVFYPNPVHDNLFISYKNADKLIVSVSGSDGKELLKTEIIRSGNLNLSGIKPGLYFLKVETGRQSFIRRIVIQAGL